jgi:hypothetical protein
VPALLGCFTNFAAGSAARYPSAVRQRLFRRHVDDLDLIESIALTAPHRLVDDDLRLSLIGAICRDISYPLLPPVVAALREPPELRSVRLDPQLQSAAIRILV